MGVRAAALWWVIGLTVGVGVVALASGYGPDVLRGVAAPAAAAGVSWVVTTRAWRRGPEALWPLMLRAFPVKALFFLGYVGFVLGVLGARVVPFVTSFTVAFLATHLTEAYCLRRLVAQGHAEAPADGKWTHTG